MTVEAPPRLRVVGRSLPFRGSEEAVAGRLTFHTDRDLPGMLHAAVARASVPHAAIRLIDIRDAAAVPGVVAVLLARDVPHNLQGPMIEDWPVLAEDRIRQVGDPVALVAATTLAAARAGAAAVRVAADPLPVVDSPEAALAPGAPLLHEGGNVATEFFHEKGDVEAALASAELVIDRTVRTPTQEHVCLEPGGGVGLFQDGRFTIWVGTQDPGAAQRNVAKALAVELEDVRIVSTPIGGAFGSKLDGALPVHLALLARACSRPVKLVLSREEVMAVGAKRHAYRIRTRLGLDRDGRILAVDSDALADTGPYASHGPAILKVSAELSTGSYRAPAARYRGRLVYTNNANAGAFRGYGVPQVTFALETALDAAADRLGIDPVEIRRRNVLRPGEEQGLYGHVVGASLRASEVLEGAAAHPLWAGREEWRSSSTAPWRRGTGIALASKGVGYGSARGDHAGARLRLAAGGRIEIWAGPNTSGQGIETAYAQIAAETLEIALEQVEVHVGDTDRVPESGAVAASRSTYAGGGAVREACRELLRRVEALGLGHPSDLAEAAALLAVEGRDELEATFVVPDVEDLGRLRDAGPLDRFSPHAVYGSSAQVVRVEVNELTGEVRVPAVACVLDCGVAINPAGVIGQAEGGIAQGLGLALMEDYRVEEGMPRTPSLETYLIPTSADVPEMDVVLIPGSEATGPFGAKGIAEVVLCPTPPAAIAAIRDAVGVDVLRPPAIPERVYRGMRGVEP